MLFSPTQATTDIEPLISIQLFGHQPAYHPGSMLRCDYQIDAIDAGSMHAVEASVLWYTDGKGDEDMGVHYFERRVPADAPDNDLRQLRSFAIKLPNTPLSYDGEILQIHWCVRVRAFAKGGKEFREDHGFRLAVLSRPIVDAGRRAPGVLLVENSTNDVSASAHIPAADAVKNQNCEA